MLRGINHDDTQLFLCHLTRATVTFAHMLVFFEEKKKKGQRIHHNSHTWVLFIFCIISQVGPSKGAESGFVFLTFVELG